MVVSVLGVTGHGSRVARLATILYANNVPRSTVSDS